MSTYSDYMNDWYSTVTGFKPLIAVERQKSKLAFDKINSLSIKQGRYGLKRCFTTLIGENGKEGLCLLVSQTQEPIDRLLYLIKNANTVTQGTFQFRVGKTFGYSEKSIAAFIKKKIDCPCELCGCKTIK